MGAFALISKLNTSKDPKEWRPKIRTLGISASKFEDGKKKTSASIQNLFNEQVKKEDETESTTDISAEEIVPNLRDFDFSILELLPSKVKLQVLKRIELLRSQEHSLDD